MSAGVRYIFCCLAVIFGWLAADILLGIFVDKEQIQQFENAQAKMTYVDVRKLNTTLAKRDLSCTYWRCFNPYRCNFYGDYRMTVYVYPWQKYLDSKNGTRIILEPSREFFQLVEAVRKSPYFEADPAKACLFLPTVDTLNQENLDLDAVGSILRDLTWWNNGENHIIFNMLPGVQPDYNTTLDVATDRAIIAGGGFSLSQTYRRTFDVSIPVFNPAASGMKSSNKGSRHLLLLSTKPYPSSEDELVLRRLQKKHPNLFLFVKACSSHLFSRRCTNSDRNLYAYPELLQTSKYCLILDGNRYGQSELSDALQFGCVPVLFADDYVLPFSEVLDWKRAAVLIYRHQLPQLIDILTRHIDQNRYDAMVLKGAFFWRSYMDSMENIALTTLRIIQDRVFPHQVRTYSEWNDGRQADFPHRLLSQSRVAPNDGFTTVILCYDRTNLLFQQLYQLNQVKSLSKIVVVWNNQLKKPPPADEWPKISKPVKVILAHANRLTNRFIPYNEIETEAVMSLDDDILMLKADEIEFGYQAWREFPSYLVGFPSRLHVYDSTRKRWTYNSEWSNNASIILTGAAFYHNYYNLLFTERMPIGVKNWIDDIMNCEDIAMNFLIANYTGQPALKVTPRKKFKSTDNVGADLSTDPAHLEQRSLCLQRLSRVFNGAILKTVEFRIDPLLYKVDAVPEDVKSYPDVGAL